MAGAEKDQMAGAEKDQMLGAEEDLEMAGGRVGYPPQAVQNFAHLMSDESIK
jgi:hypothetical protein